MTKEDTSADSKVSRSFQEGTDANSHARLREECPYPDGSRERQEWLAGWDDAEEKINTIGGTM